MASSSSCAQSKSYVYDVFLSFSGEDTRKTFVDHLYDALDRQGICTFKDDEKLERGKNISDELLQSIEDSRCFIIVFSKRYASSSWCLNELLKIMECHKAGERIAFPVFYDVDPSEVRKQTGAVGEALAIHTNKDESEVGQWREALKAAADLSGWDVRKTANGHEAQVIKIIVKEVLVKLSPFDIHVDENLVGMEKRMEALDPSLDIGRDDVRMIAIKGMGGVGKTTLAWAIFDKLSITFEGKSFVENVREKISKLGLEKLQEQVLRDVLKDKHINVQGVQDGKKIMRKRLRGTKVLVVLDDVDREEQLEELAGDPNWFKPGSRVIITTRDEQVLNIYTEKWIHGVNLLSTEEAIRLFSRHAFRKNVPTQEYEKQSRKVVHYAAGLPLSIKVLGSLFRGKNKPEWKDALSRLKTIPLKETLKVLELSYESLEDDYKEIFLDLACFLRHWKKDDAIRVLESCGFHATNGLRVLEQKSLITITETYGFISMHDSIVEMGKNIVRREHPDEPNKHSRLWIQEEIENVLADNLGSEATRCIYLERTPDIYLQGVGNMKNLRCLIVNHSKYDVSHDFVKIDEARRYFPNSLQYLRWHRYPHWCLPKTFEANNLVALELYESKLEQLWEEGKVMKNLRFLNLARSKLKRLDLGFAPNIKRLDLRDCKDLVKVYVYGGCLKSLVYLNLSDCKGLKSLSFVKLFESLEVLLLEGLNLWEFPEYITEGHSINSLQELNLSCNGDIKELPEEIGQRECLEYLDLSYTKVKHLPASICMLKHLKTLLLEYCLCLEKLPEDVGQLESLEKLYLCNCTNLREIPNSICMLKHLKTLDLSYCKYLEKLPEDVGQLESLERLNLGYCTNLSEIPNSICNLKCLKQLLLFGCKRVEKLPEEIGDLKRLQRLDVRDTPGITQLPQSLSLLKGLKISRSELKDQMSDDDGFIQLCFKYDIKKRQIQGFQHLKTLDLRRCVIKEVPGALGQLECLEELNLSYTDVQHLPDSICMLKHMKKLILQRCVFLEKLPDAVGQLESLEELYLSWCYSIRDIPGSICMLKQLKILDLYHCFCLEKLPDDVGQLESLEELYLTRCYNIREIPSSICMLQHLKKLELEGCRRLEKLPNELGVIESLQFLVIWDTGISHLPPSISLLNGLETKAQSSCSSSL